MAVNPEIISVLAPLRASSMLMGDGTISMVFVQSWNGLSSVTVSVQLAGSYSRGDTSRLDLSSFESPHLENKRVGTSP